LVEIDSRRASGVVVIGLGRFGSAVASSLVRLGHDVLAIDEDMSLVQRMASELTHVVQADGSDIETLRNTGVGDFRRAVVAIGSDIEASVLSVLALSEMQIPEIWAKATNRNHGRILERTGAHHVIYPEADMGERVAHLVVGKMMDFIEFEDGFGIAKTRAPLRYHGKTLADPMIQSRHNITIVGVKREGGGFVFATRDDYIQKGDVLVVSGPTSDVEKFAALP
jgi:trk system potassium uptake protein TrkA